MVKRPRRKFPSLIILLYFYEKGIGLCPLVLDEERLFKTSHYGFFYSITLSLTYTFFFFRVLIHRAQMIYPEETLILITANVLLICMQYVMVITSWMNFALRQKKIITIIKKFKKLGEIARKSGIQDDKWESDLRTLIIRVFLVNACYCTYFTCEHFFFTLIPNFNWTIWVPYSFPHIVIHNVLILFITALQVLKKTFHRLNIELRNLPLNVFKRKNISWQNSQSRYKK